MSNVFGRIITLSTFGRLDVQAPATSRLRRPHTSAHLRIAPVPMEEAASQFAINEGLHHPSSLSAGSIRNIFRATYFAREAYGALPDLTTLNTAKLRQRSYQAAVDLVMPKRKGSILQRYPSKRHTGFDKFSPIPTSVPPVVVVAGVQHGPNPHPGFYATSSRRRRRTYRRRYTRSRRSRSRRFV